jgi:hippurate hydrolase
VTLSGTCRAFSATTRQEIEARIRQQVHHICQAFGAKGVVDYRQGYPCTINDSAHAQYCAAVAGSLIGEANVERHLPPSMGAEDFAFMLHERPGAYVWIGNGKADEGQGLHNPYYDFNDDILPLGSSYWVELVFQQMQEPSV